MKFWTTGRIDEFIEFDIFQPVMLEIEAKINEAIQSKSYGTEIESYDVIINIFRNVPKERFRYSLKSKETDVDVNIDHDEFLYADFNRRCVLYIKAVLHSINQIQSNKHLIHFDFAAFANDISSLLKKYE
jgi:hypothetical protein